MLTRLLTDELQLITQAHHALLAGELAGLWRGLPAGNPAPLDPLLIQTIGLHDDAWRGVDTKLKWNPETGLPHDFVSFPMAPKVSLYRAGIDALEAVHPYAAFLVSLHYTTFPGTEGVDALQGPEAARRDRLEPTVSPRCQEVDVWDHDLRYLQLMDVLSLYLCMTPPGTDPAGIPPWLDPAKWARDPACGEPFALDWKDESTLVWDPFPLAGPYTVDVHYRTIRRRPYGSQLELDGAWNHAVGGRRSVRLVPA